jgi:hypothetical protein
VIDVVVSPTGARGNIKIRILVVVNESDILLTLNAVLEGRGHYVTKHLINPQKLLAIL